MKILFSSILILISLNALVASPTEPEYSILALRDDEKAFLFYIFSVDSETLPKMALDVHAFYTKKNWEITIEKNVEIIKRLERNRLISWIYINIGSHPEYYNVDKFLKEIVVDVDLFLAQATNLKFLGELA